MNGRYWLTVGLLATISVFEYFDLFLVSFLVSVISPQWGLTYGQSAIMLLCSGAGAIVGALCLGGAADRIGRKKAVISGVALCGLSSGVIALIPDGDWISFSVLRFLVGFGVGGTAAPTVALVVEYTPTRARTLVSSGLSVPAGAGVLLAALGTAALLPLIGWRGLAAVGFAPLGLAIVCIWVLPESIRWLISTGRHEEARSTAAWQFPASISEGPMPAAAPADSSSRGSLWDLLESPRKFWLVSLSWLGISVAGSGVVLWGPTLISLTLGMTPAEAAAVFVGVGAAGMIGRAFFSVLPQFVGRRASGQTMGFATAAALAVAALFPEATVLGFSLLVAMFLVAAFFYDGGCANLTPYAAEVYPVWLGARAAGLAAASNGVGRVVGPLCLALIAGTSNYVAPEATVGAITPGLLLLAASALVVGVVFTLLGIETHRVPLVTIDNETSGVADSERAVSVRAVQAPGTGEGVER